MLSLCGSTLTTSNKHFHKILQSYCSELVKTEDGGLIAWVEGSQRYATKVDMDKDGQPDSICTCPYSLDCKHGVAVVLEYLVWIQAKRRVPKARKNDVRFEIFEDEIWDDDDETEDDENVLTGDTWNEIDSFIKGKTKAQLIELVLELAEQYPDIRQNLADGRKIISGNVNTLVTRLRKDIREIGSEPGWHDYWQDERFTPDYSEIRTKLEKLLKAGYADEVLSLGNELLTIGTSQVEESHDDGETAMEIAESVPIIVKALKQSSLGPVDKLLWAVDTVLEDEFDLCEAVVQYLMGRHKKADWSLLADALFGRLKNLKHPFEGADAWSRNYNRDQLSNWLIHALEQAGRKSEIIPLCETEAKKTDSYDRLIKRLITARRYKDAERWIQEGIRVTKKERHGTADIFRSRLCEIRICQKAWPVVAAMQVEEFVHSPSRKTFTDCKKASGKVKAWSKVRESLLSYLESGVLPWKQKGWDLPETGLDAPETARKDRFSMLDDLIDIAILEKKPDQVLHWYDQFSKKRFGYGVDEDEIATAVQAHAPDRAVSILEEQCGTVDLPGKG